MKKILSLLTLSLVIVSCTPDDINPEQNFATGSKIVGFPNTIETISYFADEGQVNLNFPISLIGNGNGETLQSNIDIAYEIVAGSSTATQGVEYVMPSTGTITMTAGSTFAYLPIKVNTGLLNTVEKTTLRVLLTTASNNSVVGKQYEYVDLVFVGCKSLIAGAYSYSVKRIDIANPLLRTNETITETSVNNFVTRTTGHWTFGQLQGTNQGYDFIDICGEFTIPEQNLAHLYSNIVRPISSNNGLDGKVLSPTMIETNYEIGFSGNVDWLQYKATYTRI